MSLSDQALNLLDIQPSIVKRCRLDNFANLDSEISLSISNGTLTAAASAQGGVTGAEFGPEMLPPQPLLTTPYSMAARLERPQYEEAAKAEALMNALRQMRTNKNGRKPSPRVIRGS